MLKPGKSYTNNFQTPFKSWTRQQSRIYQPNIYSITV